MLYAEDKNYFNENLNKHSNQPTYSYICKAGC